MILEWRCCAMQLRTNGAIRRWRWPADISRLHRNPPFIFVCGRRAVSRQTAPARQGGFMLPISVDYNFCDYWYIIVVKTLISSEQIKLVFLQPTRSFRRPCCTFATMPPCRPLFCFGALTDEQDSLTLHSSLLLCII